LKTAVDGEVKRLPSIFLKNFYNKMGHHHCTTDRDKKIGGNIKQQHTLSSQKIP
jgi:hypothetical protein